MQPRQRTRECAVQAHTQRREWRAFSESAWFCSVMERATMKRRSASSASTLSASLFFTARMRP